MPSHIGLLVQDVAKAAIAGQIFPMCCNSAREEVLSLTWISGRWWWSYKPVLLGFFSWHAAPEYGRLKMNLRKQDRRKMKDGIIFEKARRLQYGKMQIEKSLLKERVRKPVKET